MRGADTALVFAWLAVIVGAWRSEILSRQPTASRTLFVALIASVVGLVLYFLSVWWQPAISSGQTAQSPSTPTVTQIAPSVPSAKEIADEVAKQLRSGNQPQELRRFLIAAQDPIPEHSCFSLGTILPNPQFKGLFFGGSVHAFLKDRDRFSVVTIGGEDVFNLTNATSGLVLNVVIRDENEKIVAKIKDNVFHSYAGNRYQASSPDQSSALVLGPNDEIMLYVRYLTPGAIKLLGIFRSPGHPTIRFEEGRIMAGNTQFTKLCTVDNAPKGSRFQTRVVFEL